MYVLASYNDIEEHLWTLVHHGDMQSYDCDELQKQSVENCQEIEPGRLSNAPINVKLQGGGGGAGYPREID